MVSENNEPADLAGFRARCAALKEEHRRRQNARDNFTAEAPDYGREIPPRLNPDVPDTVDRVKACYVGLTQWIVGFAPPARPDWVVDDDFEAAHDAAMLELSTNWRTRRRRRDPLPHRRLQEVLLRPGGEPHAAHPGHHRRPRWHRQPCELRAA